MFEIKKTGIVRRLSAWLLDVILLSVVITGAMYVISLICNYSHEQSLLTQYSTAWDEFHDEYFSSLAAYYGFTYEVIGEEEVITKDGKAASRDDVLELLIASEGSDPDTAAAYEAWQALEPAQSVNLQYQLVYNMLFMIVSLGTLIGFITLEFIVPAILKNGQTVGKKVFGIGLVRPDCVKITNVALFARTVLGKFAVETMFPILLIFLFFFGGLGILAVILLGALLLLNTVLFFATQNRTPIHDVFAGTVVVDIKLQMIYESEEELVEAKTRAHKEEVENSRDQY